MPVHMLMRQKCKQRFAHREVLTNVGKDMGGVSSHFMRNMVSLVITCLFPHREEWSSCSFIIKWKSSVACQIKR